MNDAPIHTLYLKVRAILRSRFYYQCTKQLNFSKANPFAAKSKKPNSHSYYTVGTAFVARTIFSKNKVSPDNDTPSEMKKTF